MPGRLGLLIVEFVRFCLVGSAGFVLDWGSLELFTRQWGLGPYSGRVLSFLLAATLTWKLNREYTFRQAPRRRARRQWGSYVMLVSIGALFNYGVYAVLIHEWPFALNHLIVPVAAGSLSGMFFNFPLTRRYIF